MNTPKSDNPFAPRSGYAPAPIPREHAVPQVKDRGENIVQGLNPQQRAAVEHAGTPLLIVAGAGSGKTAVLTRRIAYLLQRRGVHPGQILAITFTNKAAAEMRERVTDLVGPAARFMWVSTFHSTCVRILREQASLLPGLNSNFTIYDSDDSKRLLGMIAKDMDLDVKQYTPRTLATQISNLKNELTSVEEALQEAESTHNPYEGTIARVYQEYQRRLRSSNALDFDDLIGETVRIFRNFPEVTAFYRRRFRHVLIDEYQDTNHAQYMLVATLVGQGDDASELCVVGDSDQSIYAFRGATIRNIEEFERDFPNATTVLLEQNYRSTQTILDAANAVIDRNQQRRPKKLWTNAGAGDLITAYSADNEHDEARFVANEIDTLQDQGMTLGDMAVIYRTNNCSRAIEDALMRSGISYKVVGGTKFYERKEIRDILAYLRVLDNPNDEVSLRRIINTPRRGIGDKALAMLGLYAEQHHVGFAQALRAGAAGEVPMLGARAKNAVAGFVQLLEDLAQLSDEDLNEVTGMPNLGSLVTTVIDATGYKESLQVSNDPQDAVRLDNLNELVSVASEFSSEAALLLSYEQMDGEVELDPNEPAPGSLQAFLEKVSLVADADQIPENDQGVVTLMTLHTAKGLEFPVVFLTGWEDGLFPHQRSMGDPQELAEERRLAYVGITRAKKRLFISCAMARASWGRMDMHGPSPFLKEIPEELMDWLRAPSEPTAWENDHYGWGHSPLKRSAPPMQRSSGAASKLNLSPGDTVNHEKYGLGQVKEVTSMQGQPTAVIDFGSAGTVRLMLIGSVPMEKL